MVRSFYFSTLFILALGVAVCFSQTSQAPKTFSVPGGLGAVVYASEIPYNSSITQVADPSSTYDGKYTIRVVVFTDYALKENYMKKFMVYDNGVYKMTLYDIYMTNSNSGLKGSNFTIVNSNTGVNDGFAVLIATTYAFRTQPIIVNAKQMNVTRTYASSGDTTIYQEFMDNNFLTNYFTPTVARNMSFTGSGSVSIFAGCVTSGFERMRIATIDANNFHDFEGLFIFGSCRTYEVSKGTFSYFEMDATAHSSVNRIGQKGVIMFNNYPYTIQWASAANFDLIQSPDVSTHIAVDYEIVYIANDVTVYLEQEYRGIEKVNKTFTSADSGSTYQSISTYQQLISYTVPQNSKGVFIRYTVRESKVSTSLHSFALIMGLMIFKFLL